MKNYIQNIIKFFRTWNELLLAPLAVVLWIFSEGVIRMIEPTAATFDVAVFQKIVFGLITFCIYSFAGWMVCRIQFPKVFRFLAEDFDSQFSQLNPQVRCVISLCVLAYYLLGLALCGLIL